MLVQQQVPEGQPWPATQIQEVEWMPFSSAILCGSVQSLIVVQKTVRNPGTWQNEVTSSQSYNHLALRLDGLRAKFSLEMNKSWKAQKRTRRKALQLMFTHSKIKQALTQASFSLSVLRFSFR